MEEVTYVLNNRNFIYTSNVTHLFTIAGDGNNTTAEIQSDHSGAHRETWFRKGAHLDMLDPAMFTIVFGPGNGECYDPKRGYKDPEWYWESSDGCVWGIGWRFGITRLRGKGDINVNKASHFLDFLFDSLGDTKNTRAKAKPCEGKTVVIDGVKYVLTPAD